MAQESEAYKAEKRALSLDERNITKTEVTITEDGMMVSRLLGSKLFYIILAYDLEITQIKFYMELSDDHFKRFSVNWAKMS